MVRGVTTVHRSGAPDVIAEVEAAFERYEAALARADAATLDALFWNDAAVTRFGADEELRGHGEIAAFNAARTPLSDRALAEVRILAINQDAAVVSAIFTEVGPGRTGRQMQTWARIVGDWRVVAAHVSVVTRP
jgi:ketosteroid isomerase-like protein